MSEVALRVEDLCKSFRLSHAGIGSLKTAVLWWKKREIEKLDVLKGISFELHKGETIAVIGKNGAGKSTLLSLLARVYKPTSGTVEVNGRIAPLLELGAGFHPDLTGVENVIFNGVILGLTRKQAQERLHEIIEFSELQKHIDAPIRTYSSGMLARLGFAVAVHVDADILLVDEVLAVGDHSFQEKCFQRIDDFRANGGSILFVSHIPSDIARVADRCIWLQQGKIIADGNPGEIMARYETDEAVLTEAL